MNQTVGRIFSSRVIVLVFLISLFVLPIGIAWLMARSGFFSDAAELINNGKLLTPPISIENHEPLKDLNDIALQPGHWAVIYFDSGECRDTCSDSLSSLHKVWLVLGHDGQRVKIRSIINTTSASDTVENILNNAISLSLGSEIGTRLKLEESPVSGVVFLDWRGQIMLYFPNMENPGHLKKDLKRLLRGSKIK
jgi:hypothetical protein